MNRKERRAAIKQGRSVTPAKPAAPKVSVGVPELFAEAILHHQAGRLNEAGHRYRQALAIDPRHVDSLHLLGLVAHQAGRHDLAATLIGQAIAVNAEVPQFHASLGTALRAQGELAAAAASYRQALALKPDEPETCFNLALVLKELGRSEEAAAQYERAIALRPHYPEAHNNLANLFKVDGRLEAAADHYRRALELKPDYADAHSNLGNVFADLGRLDEAIVSYRQALAFRPNYPEVHSNLGNALNAQGKPEEAVEQYRHALALRPDYAEAHSNLGNVLQAQGRRDEAMAAYRQAIACRPTYAEAHYNLGNTLRDQGRLHDAAACYRDAISLKPDYAEAHNNWGNALKALGLLDEAAEQYRSAIAVRPDYPEAHNNLGNTLKDQGQIDEALDEYRRAFTLKPEFTEARSNLLMSLHYSARHGEADFLVEAREFARHLVGPETRRDFANGRDPERVLRIGYVSADFRDHPVGYFLARVLAAHDRANIAVTCYSNARFADAMTERLRAAAGEWRVIAGMGDAEADDLIRRDGIDVLVDLSGHTANNRLPLFARKPAPVQATWLGYFGTTGLAAMDYIVADRFVIPPGDDNRYTEKVWRMPDSYLCFSPPDLDVPVAARAMPDDSPVTLGCFNNWAKVSADTVGLWAKLLAAMPGATLLLKTKSLTDEAGRRNAIDRFAAHGIGAERLILEGHAPRAELLAAYNRVDIALDPLPYGGGTTTAEALWMGVPVVTLRGDRFVGRVSESIVATVGLADLVAADRAGYLRIVADLAADRPRLRDLRANLRSMLEASPICDGERFVRSLETAYRGMWRAWCTGDTAEER